MFAHSPINRSSVRTAAEIAREKAEVTRVAAMSFEDYRLRVIAKEKKLTQAERLEDQAEKAKRQLKKAEKKAAEAAKEAKKADKKAAKKAAKADVASINQQLMQIEELVDKEGAPKEVAAFINSETFAHLKQVATGKASPEAMEAFMQGGTFEHLAKVFAGLAVGAVPPAPSWINSQKLVTGHAVEQEGEAKPAMTATGAVILEGSPAEVMVEYTNGAGEEVKITETLESAAAVETAVQATVTATPEVANTAVGNALLNAKRDKPQPQVPRRRNNNGK